MSKRPSITLSQSIEGFVLFKRGERLSKNTIADYLNSFQHLIRYLDEADPLIEDIVPSQISAFLAHLGTVPQTNDNGFAPHPTKPLSKKSLLNIHTALSSMWTWAVEEGLTSRHVMSHVPRPDPEKRVIVPFTKNEINRIFKACRRTAPYFHNRTRDKDKVSNKRPTATRDEALICLLVDTGIRASELCNATIRDLDMANRRLKVYGKGAKERVLPFGDTTARLLWRYMVERPAAEPSHPLFALITNDKKPIARRLLWQTVRRIADRAEVPDAHPHRFRHTFAIEYLRNGGDIYTLQRLLGHSSLDMVRTYLAIAQADVEAAYRKASPLDNWGI
ncbi:MAG: tyrosine-type recombinase/integrase [Anaerolineales bacterium]